MVELATAELRALDPRLDRRITTARGTAYEGTISVATKVAFHLALDGRIGRGRPRGTWISGQFHWSPVERWLPDGIRELPVDTARAELVRRWLLAFGPGTRAALFDSAGNAGPTVWADGRIVGGWAQRPDGEIAAHLLEKVDAETTAMIDAEAARLAAWLGPTRIRWPFPPP